MAAAAAARSFVSDHLFDIWPSDGRLSSRNPPANRPVESFSPKPVNRHAIGAGRAIMSRSNDDFTWPMVWLVHLP